jgi:hypothetical protein
MKKTDSISLMLMGIGLLPIALIIGNVYLQLILLFGSIVLNFFAILRSFKEKKKHKL